MSLDTTVLTFGKHKGKTPEQVSDIDPAYIVWLYDTLTPRRCTKSLYLACVELLEEEPEET